MKIEFEASEEAVQEIIWGIRYQAVQVDDVNFNNETAQELRAIATNIEGQLGF